MNLDDYFDKYLDELHPPIYLGGEEFSYSYVFKQVFLDAYKDDLDEWLFEQNGGLIGGFEDEND